jgi:hypothetical protein
MRDYQIEEGRRAAHENQDEREGGYPAVGAIVTDISHKDPREQQPEDKPKSRLRRAALNFPTSAMPVHLGADPRGCSANDPFRFRLRIRRSNELGWMPSSSAASM